MEVKKNRNTICIVCATPLTIHLFFVEFIKQLSKDFKLTIIFNEKIDKYVNLDHLPAQFISIPFQRKISIFFDIVSFIKLIIHFRRNHYDMVWGIAPKAGLLASIASFIAGVDIRLFVFQGEVWANSTGFRRSFFKFIDRLIVKFSTNLLAVGHSERDFLISEGIVSRDQIKVLAAGSISGVDTNLFFRNNNARHHVRKKLGYGNEERVCLYLGRLNRDKGLIDLSKSFQVVKSRGIEKLKLLIVGPDEEGIRDNICEAAYPFSDDINFLPFTTSPATIMAASDLFCLPSYREGFPISILEASSCELPIIATSIYGNKDAVVDGETGRLFERGDINGLSDLLINFCEDEASFRKMGSKGRNRVIENFRSEIVVKHYLDYIQSLIKK